jgi:hypothetical protein
MRLRIARFFIMSAGFILLTAGSAKLFSGLGHAKILATADPVFQVSFGVLFWVAGSVEMILALYCFLGKNLRYKTWSVCILATCFLTYRLKLMASGYHRPCPCFGNLPDALGIPPQVAFYLLEAVFAYLLLGGYATLLLTYPADKSAR